MGGPGGPSQPSPTGNGDSRSGGETFPLTFPYGEGGSPQARRMRGAAEVTGWKYARSKAPPFRGALTAPSTNHSRSLRLSSVSLTRASSPGGEAPAPRSPLDKIEQTCYTMVEKLLLRRRPQRVPGAPSPAVMENQIRCATHRPMGSFLTFPCGEGGPPQRWMRGLAGESCWYVAFFLPLPLKTPLLSQGFALPAPLFVV